MMLCHRQVHGCQILRIVNWLRVLSDVSRHHDLEVKVQNPGDNQVDVLFIVQKISQLSDAKVFDFGVFSDVSLVDQEIRDQLADLQKEFARQPSTQRLLPELIEILQNRLLALDLKQVKQDKLESGDGQQAILHHLEEILQDHHQIYVRYFTQVEQGA